MREATITRNTTETQINLNLTLAGNKSIDVSTGCGFLDHMLTLFAKHCDVGLSVNCVGDTNVDYHHTTEDIGIALGTAFKSALGDCKGIKRYGDIILPMDEALVLCAIDISGRSYLNFKVNIPTAKVGDFDTELVWEFFSAFVRSAGVTLHIKLLDGYNSHHIIEGVYKAFARAVRSAIEICGNEIPSTKGII